MKKNIMMKIASVLLIAVLLTTCVISGTFAKYTSTTDATDGARVAKWGWGTTAISLDLFDAIYDGNTDKSVEAANGTDNLVAPGTTKTYVVKFNPDNSFKPEVAYNLNYEATGTIGDNLKDQLVFSVIAGTNTVLTSGTFDDMKAAISGLDKDYAPNADSNLDITITWTWAFEDGSDVADTALGEGAEACELTITITATQLDTYVAP